MNPAQPDLALEGVNLVLVVHLPLLQLGSEPADLQLIVAHLLPIHSVKPSLNYEQYSVPKKD